MLGRWEAAKQVEDLKIMLRLPDGFRASTSRKMSYPGKQTATHFEVAADFQKRLYDYLIVMS
ncbi:hypothetical protein C943_04490 [Mariniradius saccharolyticus AK6]|uniref:Uncharacterized protein n=1 Tax=Mariniradius saccharolyticus AK6 TaxID=1239962 RepID=M7Y8U2_9BACT|nr:hypothetical protein C943_04490 [Mariniradius saccharolyticus AK6]